ncbi:MAG: hypothetical protein Q9220_003058 [cf. Caloplaca sp. 1 TL-2023]
MARTATGRTPRAMKTREGNYIAPGVVGRATGMTLPSLGPRDENGMEPAGGLFSSPEKSPPKRNGVAYDSTMMEQDEDETMNIGSSTIPEPTDVIMARNGKTVLPPPKSRSPIKTNLGSAARRSLGPLSSPSRHNEHETPTHRAMSHPPNRRLDFSMNDSSMSITNSTGKGKLPAAKGLKAKPTPVSGKRKRGIFDLPPENDEEPPLADDESLVNGDGLANGYEDNQDYAVNGMDDSLQLPNDDSSETHAGQVPQDHEVISPSIERDAPATAKVRGKRGKAAPSKLAQAESSNAGPGAGRRGRPPSKKPKIDALAEDPIEPIEPVEEDQENAPQEELSRVQKAAMHPPKAKPKAKGGKAALTLGDPNLKLKPTKPSRRASSVQAKGALSPSKTRFITRSETPGDTTGFHTSRFGRNVVKPLAFWRGEAAVFGEGRIDEGHLVLPSIREVIRTEEIPEMRRRKTPGQPRKRRPQRRVENDELPEEDDDEGEFWETEAGVMKASVMLWDPETGRGDEESLQTADVAYAADAIETRDISGADFRFAKTLTLPFFGSGMVDLPPGGTKRVKNSRKMQMVFFVFYGRVTVDLGTPSQRFSIGRGGMWQVPRGNFYAISNVSTKPARIFFAQGCEVVPESAAFDESGVA